VGLLSGKIYIGLKLPQIYILCDTWGETDTSIHGLYRFNSWLH
jgi:hypothetical protein